MSSGKGKITKTVKRPVVAGVRAPTRRREGVPHGRQGRVRAMPGPGRMPGLRRQWRGRMGRVRRQGVHRPTQDRAHGRSRRHPMPGPQPALDQALAAAHGLDPRPHERVRRRHGRGQRRTPATPPACTQGWSIPKPRMTRQTIKPSNKLTIRNPSNHASRQPSNQSAIPAWPPANAKEKNECASP